MTETFMSAPAASDTPALAARLWRTERAQAGARFRRGASGRRQTSDRNSPARLLRLSPQAPRGPSARCQGDPDTGENGHRCGRRCRARGRFSCFYGLSVHNYQRDLVSLLQPQAPLYIFQLHLRTSTRRTASSVTRASSDRTGWQLPAVQSMQPSVCRYQSTATSKSSDGFTRVRHSE